MVSNETAGARKSRSKANTNRDGEAKKGTAKGAFEKTCQFGTFSAAPDGPNSPNFQIGPGLNEIHYSKYQTTGLPGNSCASVSKVMTFGQIFVSLAWR
jgi:hypothetical protein